MNIVGWFILFILVIVLPLGLGMIPVKNMKEIHKTPAMLYVCGWFVSFAVFEVVVVPFIVMRRSFWEAILVYTVVIALVFILSLWVGRDVIASCICNWKRCMSMSLIEKLGWGVLLAVIGAQLWAAWSLEYYDGDDAYYMAEALIATTFDEMYTRDAYTGYLFGFDGRHALSPVPIYIAWLAKLSDVHSTILAHSVLAMVWLIVMYCVYILIADKLFEHKTQYKPLFMMLIAIWLCFGNVSIYTTETFAMTRIWQGKGLMAGIILPVFWLCFLYLIEEEVQKGVWMLLVVSAMASCFATSTSVMLVPTIVGVAALLIGWKKKSIGWMIKISLTSLPCLILGLIYILVN